METDSKREVKEIMLFEIQLRKWVCLTPVLHEDSSDFPHE